MKLINKIIGIKIIRIIIIWLLLYSIAYPDTKKNSSKNNLLFYGGQYVNSDLLPISLYGDIDYKRSSLGVVGINRELDSRIGILKFEMEGLIGKHDGVMNHAEVDGLFIARVPNLFSMPISFGLGEGLSWASQNPTLENVRKGLDRGAFSIFDIQSRQFLNFLIIEFDYGFPDFNHYPRFFVRIHHRSGVWGTYCPSDPPCGSNFLVYGVKISL